jgi:opacity protein-like surface antigen
MARAGQQDSRRGWCFFTTSLAGAPFSNVRTETGWVAGGGVEYQIIQHVRVRVEYLYYRFNETTNGAAPFISSGGVPQPICIVAGPCVAQYGFSGNLNIQTVRGGISYNF